MAILLETAAAAARDADGPGSGDGLVDLFIDFQYLAPQTIGHGVLAPNGNHWPYSRITLSRRVISSADINSPCPDPGQTSQVRRQASGVRTLLSQNGQVRHCRGRTG